MRRNVGRRLFGAPFPRPRSSARRQAPRRRPGRWACRAPRRGNRLGRRKRRLSVEGRRTYLDSSLRRRDPVLGGRLALERLNYGRKDRARRKQDKLRELFRDSRFTNGRARARAARCLECRRAGGPEPLADRELQERLARLRVHVQAECLHGVRVRARVAAIRKRNATRKF